jgi:hypothetical protein
MHRACIFLRNYSYKQTSWKTLFGLCVFGASLHTLFDLLNSFGVLLFHPVCHERFELGWIFIIDLILTGLLLAPLVLRRWFDLQKVSRVCLMGAGVYILLCGISRNVAFHHLDHAESEASFTYVFPEPLGPHRFRGVARKEDQYRVYLIHSFSGSMELNDTVRTDENLPPVQSIRSSDRAKRLEAFFKAPVWRVRKDGAEVFDLRFRSIVLPRGTPFVYRLRP